MNEPKKLLTIGGWDPCGSFGVPADLKTFTNLNCHGMGVMTVVTAQNSQGWYGAEFMSADFVSQQLDSVLGDYGAESVKTGFLGKVDLIQTVASKLVEYDIQNIVVDPVTVNVHGRAMFPTEVLDAYREYLFPLATAVTPNRREFNLLLTGQTEPWELGDESVNLGLAIEFVQRFDSGSRSPAFVVKGLATEDDSMIADGLIADGEMRLIPHARVDTKNVNGTGDSFSAALCCQLASGRPLYQAVERASALTCLAIEAGANWQLATGAGPIGHFAFRENLIR